MNNKDKESSKEDQEKGYMEKVGMKVIDNIQVEIKNIHIRFENTVFSS